MTMWEPDVHWRYRIAAFRRDWTTSTIRIVRVTGGMFILGGMVSFVRARSVSGMLSFFRRGPLAGLRAYIPCGYLGWLFLLTKLSPFPEELLPGGCGKTSGYSERWPSRN